MPKVTQDYVSGEDRARLADAVEQLLAAGLIWREVEADLRAYNVLARWRDQAAAQLQAKGWALLHHEPLQAFQVVHRRGKYRRPLPRNTILGLLVLRLLYGESPRALTRYPVVAVNDITRRCAALSLSINLAEALPELAQLKLIRPAGGPARGGVLRPTHGEQLLELLPTLELAVPEAAIEKLYHALNDDAAE